TLFVMVVRLAAGAVGVLVLLGPLSLPAVARTARSGTPGSFKSFGVGTSERNGARASLSNAVAQQDFHDPLQGKASDTKVPTSWLALVVAIAATIGIAAGGAGRADRADRVWLGLIAVVGVGLSVSGTALTEPAQRAL